MENQIIQAQPGWKVVEQSYDENGKIFELLEFDIVSWLIKIDRRHGKEGLALFSEEHHVHVEPITVYHGMNENWDIIKSPDGMYFSPDNEVFRNQFEVFDKIRKEEN